MDVDMVTNSQKKAAMIELIFEHNPIAARACAQKLEALLAGGLIWYEDNTAQATKKGPDDDIILMWKMFFTEMWTSIFKYGYATVGVKRAKIDDNYVRLPVVVPPTLYYVVNMYEWTRVLQKKERFQQRTVTEQWKAIFYEKKDEQFYTSKSGGPPFVVCLNPPVMGISTSSVARLYDVHQKFTEHVHLAAAVASRNAYPQGYFLTVPRTNHPSVNPGAPQTIQQAAIATMPLGAPDEVDRLTARLLREQQSQEEKRTDRITQTINRAVIAPMPEMMRSHIGRSENPGDHLHSTLYPAGPDVTSIEFIPRGYELGQLVDKLNWLTQRMCTIVGVSPTMLNIPMQGQRSGQRDDLTITVWRCQVLAEMNFANSCLKVIGETMVYNEHWQATCDVLEVPYKKHTYVQLSTAISLEDTMLIAPFFTAKGMQQTLAQITQLPQTLFRDTTPPPTDADRKRPATSSTRPAKKVKK
jgi:hypothetical protein